MTVYLDHAATTPMRPEAVAAMLPFLTERFGNPSGVHAVARSARLAIDEARDAVAAGLGCQPGEVIFTGGGTEADNLAIFGAHAAVARRPSGVGAAGKVVGTAIEHHAVLHSVAALGGETARVTTDGVVDLDHLSSLLDDDVRVVSVMLANNEVGTIQPLAEVAALVRALAPQAVLHTDAVQAFPWVDVASAASMADLVAISAHKFGGPKGVGALVARGSVALEPLIRGGGQERDRRSGTHNVAGIVAMAAAIEATVRSRPATVERVAALRDRLAEGLLAAIPESVETAAPAGSRAGRIAGSCHLRFPGVESEALLLLLDEAGICASAGSACASGAIEPSHVLTAMGVSEPDALTSVRLSLGPTTTDDDIDLALKVIPESVARLRKN